jgi:hypothetical protein
MNGYWTLFVEKKQEPVLRATNRTWTVLRSKPFLRGERPATNIQNISAASHLSIDLSLLVLDTLFRALNATDQFLTGVQHIIYLLTCSMEQSPS